MNKDAQNLCSKLNIKYDEKVDSYFEEGLKLFKEKGNFAIDKERLIKHNEKYSFFRKWFDDVLLACDAIEGNDDLLTYIYTLVCVIMAKEDISIFPSPDFGTIDTDFAPLFSLLYFLEDMIGEMEERKLPYKVISDTLNGFDSEITDYYNIHGRSGMRTYVAWFLYFVRGEIFRIGRFQFQIAKFKFKVKAFSKNGEVKLLMDGENMHKNGMVFGSAKQDDEEGKYFADIRYADDEVSGYQVNELGECNHERITLKGYSEELKLGDWVLSVHIPSDGKLDFKESEKSYADALKIFKNSFPEYDFKAFVCYSWLLEKRLKFIMGRDTNITKFADMYHVFPLQSQGAGVYSFLFSQKGVVDPSTLPEKSSMHTAVKKYLIDGNIFYEKGGIRLFNY